VDYPTITLGEGEERELGGILFEGIQIFLPNLMKGIANA